MSALLVLVCSAARDALLAGLLCAWLCAPGSLLVQRTFSVQTPGSCKIACVALLVGVDRPGGGALLGLVPSP